MCRTCGRYRGGKCIKVNGKPEKEYLCDPSVGNTIIKKCISNIQGVLVDGVTVI